MLHCTVDFCNVLLHIHTIQSSTNPHAIMSDVLLSDASCWIDRLHWNYLFYVCHYSFTYFHVGLGGPVPSDALITRTWWLLSISSRLKSIHLCFFSSQHLKRDICSSWRHWWMHNSDWQTVYCHSIYTKLIEIPQPDTQLTWWLQASEQAHINSLIRLISILAFNWLYQYTRYALC